MKRTAAKNSIGLLALVTLSACTAQGVHEQRAFTDVRCKPTETLACDRFAGENYNCSCEQTSRLRDILLDY